MLRRLVRNPLALLGLVLVLGFVAVAVAAPYISPPRYPHEPYRIARLGWTIEPRPPSPRAPLGTTEGQYDLLHGIVWGARSAFSMAVAVVAANLTIGILLGTLAGYYGGALDELLMRVTDVFMAFPILLAGFVLATLIGKGLRTVFVTLVAFGWMQYARLMRAGVLQTRAMEYVEAARAMGMPTTRILLRYILPNCIYPVLVQASLDLGSVVVFAATFSFLGIGADPGYADWGQLIAFSRNWILGRPGQPLAYWHTVVLPGAAILLFVLGWNLLGDGLRDAMDPRLRHLRK